MIISREHRFIFIRCRKTASTSTEIWLSRFLGPHDVNTAFCARDEAYRLSLGGIAPQNLTPPNGSAFFNHMSAAEIQARVDPNEWSSFFRFCFERNPWDKAISLYFHRYKHAPRPDFDRFVASGEVLDCRNFELYTINGKPAVDFIGRYECLLADLSFACRQVGLPCPESLPSAKRQFRVDGRPYRDFLTDAQAVAIGQLFREEIRLLGYRFDDPTAGTQSPSYGVSEEEHEPHGS